ncbi:MAG: DUF1549 domain-containing protein [Saprospiraceae bacterium]|nr:DUF1549 domain-containing protein [Saprospiraceae bacterium]
MDVTGLLPTPDEVIIFNNDKSPDKREKIVHQLLSRNEAYTLHWLAIGMIYCVMITVAQDLSQKAGSKSPVGYIIR